MQPYSLLKWLFGIFSSIFVPKRLRIDLWSIDSSWLLLFVTSLIFFFFVAWVGSLCMACGSFFGPLAAKLCDRLGCRAVSISGALICIVSLLTSSRVPHMWMLYFTFSCMYGFGASCVHTALFLVVSASFDKGRSLATGTSWFLW